MTPPSPLAFHLEGETGGFGPTTAVAVPTGEASAGGVAPTPVVVVGSAALYLIGAEPGYNLPAAHDDPVAHGTEVVLAAAVLFVGWKLVGGRTFRP
jgi:hypothetical protein